MEIGGEIFWKFANGEAPTISFQRVLLLMKQAQGFEVS